MDGTGFFTLLAKRAGSQQRENQLSSTFAACFAASPLFRQQALDVVRRACRINKPLPCPDEWACATEVAPPKDGGGRVDISIRPTFNLRGGALPVFWLENKVTAPLTEKQLKKYRKHGCDYVIAITEHRPEVTPRRLRELGVYAVRWQDFHRALTGAKGARSEERFLIDSFVSYLEDLGMAHRQKITLADLNRLSTVWQAMHGEKKYVAVRDAYRTADSLVELLTSVRERLIEAYPKQLGALMKSGPNCVVEGEGDERSDSLRWSLNRGGNWKEWQFISGMYFWNADRSVWFFATSVGTEGEALAEWPLTRVTTAGVLDEDKLLALVKASAKRWRVV